MRIEKIHFKNLNSLKGEWTIDLTHPLYGDTGLFAITGPTGAGKSTILDAVSLALYARTPRLERITKSENEIMTRGEHESFSIVDFQANHQRYRAEWRQHRAKQSAAGALQEAKVALYRFDPDEDAANPWRLMAGKKGDFATQVRTVTGLDFKQFTRSVLLAQGNFAAFLRAPVDERAQLLEHITGTGIYSDISQAVHVRYAEEAKALMKLEVQRDQLDMLSADARRELQEEIRNQNEAARGHEAALSAVNDVLKHYQNAARIERELAGVEADRQKALAAHEAAAPFRQQIQAARRALAIADAHTRLCAARDALKRHEEEAPRVEARLQAASKTATDASQALDALEKTGTRTQAAYEALLSVLPQVRTLDRTIGELRQTALTKAQAVEKAETEAAALAKNATDKAAEETRNHERIAQLDAGRIQRLPDAGLPPKLSNISSELTRWEAQADNEKQNALDLAQTRSRRLRAEQSLAALASRLAELNARQAQEDEAHAAAQARLAQALQEDSRACLQEKLQQWRQRETALDALVQDVRQWETQRAQCLNRTERLTALKTQAVQAEGEKQNLEAALRLSEDTTASLEARIAALTDIARLEDLRQQLANDSPCPLCGALHHPFVERRPDVDTTGPTAQLKKEKTHLADLRRRLQKATEALAALKAEVSTLTQTIEADAVRLRQEEAALRERALACRLTNPEAVAMEAQTALVAAREEAQRLAQREKLAAQADDDQRTAQNRRRTIELQQQELLRNKAGLEAQREAADADLARLTDAARRLHEEKEAAARRFTTLTAAHAPDAASPAEGRTVLDELTRRAKDFTALVEELNQRRAAAATLEAQRQGLVKQSDDARTRLETARGEVREIETRLQQLRNDRTTLFGAKSPEQEEARCGRERTEAASALQLGQARAQAAQTDLAARRADQQRLKEDLRHDRTRLEEAAAQWRLALAGQSFADDEAWQCARRKPEEIERMEATLLACAERLTALQSQKDIWLKELGKIRETLADARPEDALQSEHDRLDKARSDAEKAAGAAAEKLKRDDELQQRHQSLKKAVAQQQDKAALWGRMDALIGGSDGKRYREFVQGLTFEHLVDLANIALEKLTDRYTLTSDADSPLTVNVVDHYQAEVVRSSQNLSGGETFIVSLALALGLSRLAGKNVRVESLFLDEGFGTLDEAALDNALSMLAGLKSEGKIIGLISHVGQIRERIPAQIEVTPQKGGVSRLSGAGITRNDRRQES